MRILTGSGYKEACDCVVGEVLPAFDILTGAPITNTITSIDLWFPDDDDPQQCWYLINGTYRLYAHQSIWIDRVGWTATTITHGHSLEVGDTIYDDNDRPISVDTIEVIDDSSLWYRLEVSGDHSFIGDGLSLHNASRFWVGLGSTTNWNSSPTTNWGATSGSVGTNASVPGSSDTATFDGAGAGGHGNDNNVISANITVVSVNYAGSAYTGNTTINSSVTLTINAGTSGALTFSSGQGTLTAGSSSTSVISFTAAATQTLTTAGKTIPFKLSKTTNTMVIGDNLTFTGDITFTPSTLTNTTKTWTYTGSGTCAFNVNQSVAILTVNASGTLRLTTSALTVSGATTVTAGTLDTATNNIGLTTAGLAINGTSTLSIGTNHVTISGNNNYSNASGATITGANKLRFSGATQTLTSNAVSLPCSVESNGSGCAFTTVGALTCLNLVFTNASDAVTLGGALTTTTTATSKGVNCTGISGAGFAITTKYFVAGAGTVNLGGAALTITAPTVGDTLVSVDQSATYTAPTSIAINLTAAGDSATTTTVFGSGATAGFPSDTIGCGVIITDNANSGWIMGVNTAGTALVLGGSLTWLSTATTSNKMTTDGTKVGRNLTVTNLFLGGNASANLLVQSTGAGNPGNITCSSVPIIECPYLTLTDMAALGTAKFYAERSTDSGGNTGWIFAFPPFKPGLSNLQAVKRAAYW